jgi:hypothetical protein
MPVEPGSANGRLLGAFFIDGGYTVLFSYQLFDPPSFRVVASRISKDGRLIDGPRVIFEGGFVRAAATNGSRIVMTAEDEIVAITASGEITQRTPIHPAYGLGIASNGTGFLAVALTYDGVYNSVTFVALDANGSLAGTTRVLTTPLGEDPMVSSDGTDYLAMYMDARLDATMAERVSAQAEIRSTTIAPKYSALGWNGDAYFATTATVPEENVAVATLDRSGKLIAPARPVGTGTPGAVNQRAIAWNGSETLLVWTSGLQRDPDGYEVTAAIAQRRGDLLPVKTIPTSSNMQVSPVIATSGSQDLVAWVERDGVFAARLTAEALRSTAVESQSRTKRTRLETSRSRGFRAFARSTMDRRTSLHGAARKA